MSDVILRNVRKSFGAVNVIKGVDLEIKQGEFVVFVGPSGCGKSTLLRLIAGLEMATAGSIVLEGRDITNQPSSKRDLAMVFQSYAIFPHLNVFENIAYGLNVQRLPKDVIERRVGKVLELVHLEGYGQRAPTQLSGGQQQRVALARALVMEPKVLLMDEPLSNLDAKLREEMRTEIRRIQKELNITSVYVTHDQIEAMTLSDRIVVMNLGLIEQIGTPMEMYRYPASRFVANFIGRANFVDGVIQEHSQRALTVKTLGEVVRLKDVVRTFKPEEAVTLIVRPEMVRVKKSGEHFKGIVRRAVYLGDVCEYDVEISGQVITGLETDPTQMELFAEGDQVSVGFAEGCIQALPAEK